MSLPDQDYWRKLLVKLQYFEQELKAEDGRIQDDPSLDILKEIIKEQFRDEDTVPPARTAG